MRDTKFAVTMALVILGMVVGMALLAVGCNPSYETRLRKFRYDGACFVEIDDKRSYVVVNYPCPAAKEQLL